MNLTKGIISSNITLVKELQIVLEFDLAFVSSVEKIKPVANGIDKDNKDENGCDVKSSPLSLGVPRQQVCLSLNLFFLPSSVF